LKLINIEQHFSMVKVIRIYTDELYDRYKIIISAIGAADEDHLLLKIIAELESTYTEN